jgi:hypothetical protein
VCTLGDVPTVPYSALAPGFRGSKALYFQGSSMRPNSGGGTLVRAPDCTSYRPSVFTVASTCRCVSARACAW